ncbi:MAG: hypothetical protein ACR2N2_00325 [Acidimicrobiia bacterium]
MRRLVLITALVALLAAACGSSDTSDTGTPPDTGLPDSPERCEELDPLVLDHLRSGLIVEASLPWGFSVKSTDYDDVWIVTAAVEADALTEKAFGTWAIRAGVWPSSYIGTVEVDEIAMRITDFGDGSIVVTGATDGVLSAQACAQARIEAGG